MPDESSNSGSGGLPTSSNLGVVFHESASNTPSPTTSKEHFQEASRDSRGSAVETPSTPAPALRPDNAQVVATVHKNVSNEQKAQTQSTSVQTKQKVYIKAAEAQIARRKAENTLKMRNAQQQQQQRDRDR